MRMLLTAAVLLPAVTLTGPPTAAGANAVMEAGRTVLVSGSRPAAPNDPAAVNPVLNAAGTEAIYPTPSPQDQLHDVVRRNLITGHTDKVSRAGWDSTSPSTDASGTTVAYVSAPERLQRRGNLTDAAVFVTSGRGAGSTTTRVSGTTSDPPELRVADCPAPSSVDPERAAPEPCGPSISADARSIAYAGVLSTGSSLVTLRPVGPAPLLDGLFGSTSIARLLDFGVAAELRLLDVRLEARARLRLTDARVIEGRDHFKLVASARVEDGCQQGALLRPGDPQCLFAVRIQRGRACGPVFGRLAVEGPSPVGRLELALMGMDLSGCSGTPVQGTPRRACAGAAAIDARLAADDPPLARSGATVLVGSQAVGSRTVITRRLTNDTTVPVTVGFATGDCGLHLHAAMGDVSAELCVSGLLLSPGDSCTAVVVFEPRSVASYAAALTLSTPGDGPINVVPVFGDASEEVVVMRRDANGDGDFAGVGDPPAKIVSLDDDGNTIDGRSPSLSADGRFVAFTSTRAGILPGARVLVHDTDRLGDQSHQAGRTVQVPDLALPVLGSLQSAFAPSLSDDGRRVAYVAHRLLDVDVELGTPTPEPGLELSITVGSLSVEARDLATGRSAVVSTAPGTSSPADGWNQQPVISADGRSVGFVSDSADLWPDGTELLGTGVYIRDLGPDLAHADTTDPDLVSLRENDDFSDGSAWAPTLSADGGVIAFASDDYLTSDAVAQTAQVYARLRASAVGVAPLEVAYPRQQVGTIGSARPVRVSNAGPGPVHVTTDLSGPYTVEGCQDVAIHRAESCTALVRFAPRRLGRQLGELTVTTSTTGWPDFVEVVSLEGVAVPTVMRLDPVSVVFPDVGVGQRAQEKVLVRNVADSVMVVEARPQDRKGDFDLSVPASCGRLRPGATCRLTVEFHPRRLGDHEDVIEVESTIDEVPVVQEVPVIGATAEPQVTFSPAVAYQGRVTFVHGINFYPGRLLLLSWTGGLMSTPVVMAEPDGTFSVPVVVLRGIGAGVRQLEVSMVLDLLEDAVSVKAPPLLVVQGSAQPPDFVTRD